MEMHGKNFTLITRQVTLQCAFVRKMIQRMKILFENVDSVEYCSGEEYALGIWKWGLISHFAGYLCDPGKLFSQNLFCQLSREHYNPSPPGLLQGLHKMMHLKHLMCDWHTTGMQ